MTSGRSDTALAATPGSARSAARVFTWSEKLAGRAGATMSISVSLSIGWPCSARSTTSRSVSLRPIIPAAPVIRICMGDLLKRQAAIDQMRLAGDVARLVARQEQREVRDLLRGAEPAERL